MIYRASSTVSLSTGDPRLGSDQLGMEFYISFTNYVLQIDSLACVISPLPIYFKRSGKIGKVKNLVLGEDEINSCRSIAIFQYAQLVKVRHSGGAHVYHSIWFWNVLESRRIYAVRY